MSQVSYRIMKTNEFPDAVFYHASCACGSTDCTLVLVLEYHEDTPSMVFLTVYTDLKFSAYWHNADSLLQAWWRKLKVSLRLLFTGYIRVEEGFIFQGEEHIDGFIQALQEGKEKVRGGCNE